MRPAVVPVTGYDGAKRQATARHENVGLQRPASNYRRASVRHLQHEGAHSDTGSAFRITRIEPESGKPDTTLAQIPRSRRPGTGSVFTWCRSRTPTLSTIRLLLLIGPWLQSSVQPPSQICGRHYDTASAKQPTWSPFSPTPEVCFVTSSLRQAA